MLINVILFSKPALIIQLADNLQKSQILKDGAPHLKIQPAETTKKLLPWLKTVVPGPGRGIRGKCPGSRRSVGGSGRSTIKLSQVIVVIITHVIVVIIMNVVGALRGPGDAEGNACPLIL